MKPVSKHEYPGKYATWGAYEMCVHDDAVLFGVGLMAQFTFNAMLHNDLLEIARQHFLSEFICQE